MFEHIRSFGRDLRLAARSLTRAKTLSIAVIVTLALGIGANVAMFSLFRGVLLRPLVNRDEGRLVYVEQSANGKDAGFSIPEIDDLRSRTKMLTDYGDFSTIGFTVTGLGEPRTIQAGVVSGSYFQTMGLRPVLGRLIDSRDDGPKAEGVAVLTYRFWSSALNRDPSVIGKNIRLSSFIDSRNATIIGVLEPSLPYPQETEIIANVVTSAHHLSATMVTGRIHRMTEVFARLAPGATLEQARAELDTVYKGMEREHPEAYPTERKFQINATRLRDQLTSDARTILMVLMGASLLVFIIAVSNAANLILARTLRRENELGIRAALGASNFDLRRVLLAESLLLCVIGAGLGVLIADPLLSVLSQYASRFSLRALDLTLDSSMLWVAAGLALLAAALLAFVPRLPSVKSGAAITQSSGSSRVSSGANRRLKGFVLVQVGACFVLIAAAAATVNTLLSLESVRARFETRHVLAVNVPVLRDGRTPQAIVNDYREAMTRIRQLPGVQSVSLSSSAPYRDRGTFTLQFAADGHVATADEKKPSAEFEVISPGFFTTLGIPLTMGRDFNDADRANGEPVAIVSQSLADLMFPGGDALNHHVMFNDPVLQFAPGFKPAPHRIVGIVPDIDNTNFNPRPTLTIYHAVDQEQLFIGSRLLVESSSDPYALVQPITRIMHSLNSNQPVEDAKTLEDIKAEVLSPERLNVIVSGVFAVVSLLIAVIGVAGVLMFLVSGRTREFGIRLALGSKPKHLLVRVITEGALMAVGGLALGLIAGYAAGRLAGSLVGELKMPGVTPLLCAALLLLISAITAAAIPAARAARVDVMEALRSE